MRTATVARQPREKTYWWIHAKVGGRDYLLGPYATQSQAQQAGICKIPGDFRTVALPTRDISTASRLLKGKFTQSNQFSRATRRLSHRPDRRKAR